MRKWIVAVVAVACVCIVAAAVFSNHSPNVPIPRPATAIPKVMIYHDNETKIYVKSWSGDYIYTHGAMKVDGTIVDEGDNVLVLRYYTEKSSLTLTITILDKDTRYYYECELSVGEGNETLTVKDAHGVEEMEFKSLPYETLLERVHDL